MPDYSDIDLSRWREYDHVWTDSLWLINARDRTGGHHLDYHGNFIPQIATQVYLRYTRRDDIVLDLFTGSGTAAIEAARMERRFVGVELKPDLVEYVRTKLPPDLLDHRVHLLPGDSTASETVSRIRAVLNRMGTEYAHLLVLHPPYHDIIRFSSHPADLSNADSVEDFLERFETVARHGFDLLTPGRFAVLVIGDTYRQGALIPLGFYCLERMQRVGFRPKAIVVKNITGNERGKGRASNLWRYRALAGGYYIFKHEYVIIFQKPKAVPDMRAELLQVREMPPWGRVQGDDWDRASRFIYNTYRLSALRRETKRVAAEMHFPLRDFGSYVIRRWYNFHTHQVALEIILSHPRTRPEPDPFHPTVDFYLQHGKEELGFDLKLTSLPRGFSHDLAYAQAHPEALAHWLYTHQSSQRRFHTANRLFVVLYNAAAPERTWELRRDFERLKQSLYTFLDAPRLIPVEVPDLDGHPQTPRAGVVFCT